jgi:predicted  nucleic acid-binding Zn-ribbon protein
MTMDVEIGVLVSVALAVIGAWWGLAKMFIAQFEQRQNERFDALQDSISSQKRELDNHMHKQEKLIGDLRQLEIELSRSQIDAATRYQTKDDAGKQFAQLVNEIRSIGSRIDLLHSRVNGSQ